MAILMEQTIVGNIGSVYEMRTVGKDQRAVIDFTVAVTPRKKVDDDWVDGDTYWANVTAWGKLAENISTSFRSGDRVFVKGRTDMKAGYENKAGEQVPARPMLTADFAGLELGNHSAKSDRVKRDGGSTAAPEKKAAPKKATKPAVDDLDFDDDDEIADF
jgi:single stranded DNA-binding protein